MRKEVYQNNYTKQRYQAESTDESGSLSYNKSRDENKSEESLRGFKIIQYGIPVWYCYNCNVLLPNKPSLSLSPCH